MRLTNLNSILMDMADEYNNLSSEDEKLGFRKAMAIVRNARILNEDKLPVVRELREQVDVFERQLESFEHIHLKIQYNYHEYSVAEICKMLDEAQELKKKYEQLDRYNKKIIETLKSCLKYRTEYGVVHISQTLVEKIVRSKPQQ